MHVLFLLAGPPLRLSKPQHYLANLRLEHNKKTDEEAGAQGTQNPQEHVHAGNDLIMPGGLKYKKRLIKDFNKGTLSVEELDKAVINILNFVVK